MAEVSAIHSPLNYITPFYQKYLYHSRARPNPKHLHVGLFDFSLLPHQISIKHPPLWGSLLPLHPRVIPHPAQLVIGKQGCCPLGCLPLGSPPSGLHRGEAGEQRWQQQKLSTQRDCKTTAENSLALNVQGPSPEAVHVV